MKCKHKSLASDEDYATSMSFFALQIVWVQ